MTDLVRGTVLGIDRENGTVRAEIAGVVVPAAPYLGEPPWPLSSCWFFNAPAYTCLGPIGNRRVAFADDFNFYTAGTPLIGGTGWSAGGAAGGSLSTPNNPTDGNGVLRLTNTTVASPYFIRKTRQLVTLADTRCYWMSARVRASSSSAGIAVGLADTNAMNGGAAASTDAAAYALFAGWSSPQLSLFVAAGTSQDSVSVGTEIASDTWVWIDVMVVGGQWAAVWADGSGPWVLSTPIPSTSQDSVTPFVSVTNQGASTTLDVDYASLALVDLATTADPTTFGELDPIDDVLT